jgi:hypothetical protein
MPNFVIHNFAAEHLEAVKAFNIRLREAGVLDLQFPESEVPAWLPKIDDREIYHEYYVALEGDMVRGGYIMKYQPFYVGGELLQLCEYRLPLSEALVDKTFAPVGVQMYLDANRKQSRLYTVGIGGFEEPAAQMLARAGWNLWAVPFFFRVLRPARFLRNIVYLRRTTARKLVLDALAMSGLGNLAVPAFQAIKTPQAVRDRDFETATVGEFGPWADEIWQAAHPQYKMIAVRDRTILNILYPASDPRWIRLRVSVGGRVVGWATVLNVPMQGHNYFGNMRVGSLIDCLALPGMESKVAHAALEHMRQGGADIAVTNLLHRDWQRSLLSAGFMQGPSNFIFAASKPVSVLIAPFEENKELVHMTRGDGGGPQNLLAVRDVPVVARAKETVSA